MLVLISAKANLTFPATEFYIGILFLLIGPQKSISVIGIFIWESLGKTYEDRWVLVCNLVSTKIQP